MAGGQSASAPVSTKQKLDPRFADTFFVVEADTFAQHALWRQHAKDAPQNANDQSQKVAWRSDSLGVLLTLGELDGRPVCVSFTWATLNGKRVLFYNATSEVVDHKLVGEWLQAHCNPKWDNGQRRAHCDAQNFHHCLHALHEVAELSMPAVR
jgi:hypothetical protein